MPDKNLLEMTKIPNNGHSPFLKEDECQSFWMINLLFWAKYIIKLNSDKNIPTGLTYSCLQNKREKEEEPKKKDVKEIS